MTSLRPLLTETGVGLSLEDGSGFLLLEDQEEADVHSPAEIVQQLLIDAGIGTDPDLSPLQSWPVYSTNEPDLETLDEVITVTDTAGADQGRTMVDGEEEIHYGVQIRVDARSHENYGWRKTDAIRSYCSQTVYQAVVVIDSIRYLVLNFSRIGPVIPTGKDVGAVKRSIFTFNPTVVIRRLS